MLILFLIVLNNIISIESSSSPDYICLRCFNSVHIIKSLKDNFTGLVTLNWNLKNDNTKINLCKIIFNSSVLYESGSFNRNYSFRDSLGQADTLHLHENDYYCEIRQNNLALAEVCFKTFLKKYPYNIECQITNYKNEYYIADFDINLSALIGES